MMDIDRLLKDAGATWRSSEPDPPSHDWLLRQMAPWRASALRTRHAKALAFASVSVGVSVVIGIGFMSLRPSSGPDPRAGSISRALAQIPVQPGDRVTGVGSVIVNADTAEFCVLDGMRLRADAKPSCSPIRVKLVGLDKNALPSPSRFGETTVSERVAVLGTWTGEALSVDSVSPATADSVRRPVPCPPPPGGWPSDPPTSAALENALNRLGGLAAGRPDLYAGLWSATADSGQAVAVVSTVGEPETAHASLGRDYPYALCVVRVEFSSDDLNRVAAILGRPDRTWQANVSPEENRVVVRLAILDPPAATALGKLPEAMAQPLVVRAP
jgi:hypothetical protein